MPEAAAPRTAQQRKKDTLHRLEHDVDAWVSTADLETGAPYMVPLSFLWTGSSLLLATAASTPTARNLSLSGTVRMGIGETRDVILVDGTAQPVRPADLPPQEADAFAAKTGFDPREEAAPYLYFRVSPRRLQAWREVNEFPGRDLIVDGRWTVA
ncbi:pyridoxamine 5'-phosphate oxidase family protein [Streptomyces montanisoli]|uniref:Pyridoxamine 5'-phosphate oxidase family protein n=1 Tax=Streptomyces montanisoli TaxID=2798581 RepID=A0A940MFH4_9ACTN|nr:pyridoxamine 5'-phosphate oxidase family protein [Streptomyces montanisoli]MBP0458667.1 pyridoxamine 5'-phosphate oxidase family protein [Streptomyces montanisoli]